MTALNQASVSLIEQDAHIELQARKLAEQSSIRTLLNCYIREVAKPRGQLTESLDRTLSQTLPLGWRHIQRNNHWLLISLPHSQHQLLIAVTRATLMGNYRYAYPMLGRSTQGQGAAWAELSSTQLAELLVNDLCLAESVPYNQEFLQQIQYSLDTTTQILRHTLSSPIQLNRPDDLYLYSEQSLAYGHAFHPTPKCRQWGFQQNEAEYAPEYRCDFQLHWFRVKSDLLRVETVAPLTSSQLINDICPEDSEQADTSLVPVHPAQAQYLLTLPSTQQAIEHGLIEYIGAKGKAFAPTASVRTLYNPSSRWFLKGSLKVRITNCVRKNAIYELESALALHQRLQKIAPSLQAQHSGFRLLGEPGFLTLELPGLTADDNKAIQEGFGMVVRQNINNVLATDEEAVMAGALFQQGAPLKAFISITDKLSWLKHYAEALIPPVLEAFFEHGVIFEPHLQNTIICLKNNQPSGTIVRDFEGVKLVDQRWPFDSLHDLSERAQQSVRYSYQQGWNRVRYCLFINNLAEAVSYLADDHPQVEQELWHVVEQVTQRYLDQSSNPKTLHSLGLLLSGEAIPSKTNLLVRILKNPDKQAGYVNVSSPFNSAFNQ